MRKKYKGIKAAFLISTILFIGFSFEFFIRSQLSFGMILFFNGLLNLIVYQSFSRKIRQIHIALSFFNGGLSYLISDSYGLINYQVLYFSWLALSLAYLVLTIYKIYARIQYRKHRKKIRDHFNS